jgi:photosystem II stability/assembly factor-like uncharacterized protein
MPTLVFDFTPPPLGATLDMAYVDDPGTPYDDDPTNLTHAKDGSLLDAAVATTAGARVEIYLLDDTDLQLADVTDLFSGITVGEGGALATADTLTVRIDTADAGLGLLPLTAQSLRLGARAVDGAGNETNFSSSPPLNVDNVAPENAQLAIVEAPLAPRREIELAPSCVGATEMYLDGDVVDETGVVRTWIPLAGSVPVTLTDGDGAKTVTAYFRDAAHNFSGMAPVEATTFLATGDVISDPVLNLPPGGQTQLKNGDALTVSGSGEPGATIVSAGLVELAGGTTVQDVTTDLGIDQTGMLFGNFVAAGLNDGDSVALQVILSARGRQSFENTSRSLPLVVDNTPPTSPSVMVDEGGTVSGLAVNLTLGALAADEMFIDGDIEDEAGAIRTWRPVASAQTVTLTAGNGGKSIFVTFRDLAFNEVLANTTVFLDDSTPASLPSATNDWPVAKVKNNDLLHLAGGTDRGTSIVSADVVDLDAAGTPLTAGSCTRSVLADVTLTGTAFSGDVSVGTPCSGAVRAALQVVVANDAGTQSVAADSLSNSFLWDNAAPTPSSASLKVVGLALTDQSPDPDATLLLDAEDGDGSQVQMLITGDVSPSARVGTWVDFPGTQVVPGEEPITLASGDGLKVVTVQFRDAIENVSTAATLNIELDTAAPNAPDATKLQLVETNPSPTNPAMIAEANHTFSLMGNSGAVVSADRAQIYADVGLTNLLATVDVDGGGAFPATALAYQFSKTWYVVAVDPAGHQSGTATSITVPKFSAISASPVPSRSGLQTDGNPVQIQFTTSSTLSGNPVVTVGGGMASFSGLSGMNYTYTYTPSGGEPTGAGQAVVRIQGNDNTGFAPGTSGTAAITHTFDFANPTATGGSMTVTENDPGTSDQVSGSAGAVGDDQTPGVNLLVSVYDDTGTILRASSTANADGSFDPINIGDNLDDAPVVRVRDLAGNEVGLSLANDRVAPVISNLQVTPEDQVDGQVVVVSFDVTDDTHDLRDLPLVFLAGRAASHTSGTLGTSDGFVHSFAYSFTVNAAGGDPEGVHNVDVSLLDASGNPQTAQASVIFDFTSPLSTATTPGTCTQWNAKPGVLGNASDGLSGLAVVEVSLHGQTEANYWDSASGNFDSATEKWHAATGLGTWTYVADSVPFVNTQNYTLRWRATDVAGNVQVPPTPCTFQYDSTQPDPPTVLIGDPTGEASIDISWTAPAAPPDYYLVYYAKDEGTTPPYDGVGAAEGDSPIVVDDPNPANDPPTTLTLTDLPRGNYRFVVTAVDDSARESEYSNQITLPSRWWEWKNPPRTSNSARDMEATTNGTFVAVGYGGSIWRSTDGGVSWQMPDSPGREHLEAVCSVGDVLVAVGWKGQILRSTDDGATWAARTSSVTSHFYDVTCTANHIVATAFGANFVYSNDDGDTWSDSTVNGTGGTQYAIWSVGNNVVTVGAFGDSMLSTDGGQTFNDTISNTGQTMRDIWGVGNTIVAVGSNGAITRSFDGGATWAAYSTGAAEELYDVWGESNNIVVVGEDGRTIYSNDGGTTFNIATSASNNDLLAVRNDGSRFVAVGFAQFGGGANVVYSTDGGVNWSLATMPGPNNAEAQAAVAFNGTNWAATGSFGSAQYSTDDSANWTVVANGTANESIHDFSWESDAIVVVGRFGQILRSTDSAQSFTHVNTGYSYDLNDVFRVGDTLVAAGYDHEFAGNGRVLRSADAGATWTIVDTGEKKQKWGVYGNGGTWVTVGDNGQIARSTDDGVSFAGVTSGTSSNLNAVCGQGANLVAVGTSGTILFSTDTGATWNTPTSNPTGDILRSVWCTGSTFIAVGGPSSNSAGVGILVRSTDGGDNWSLVGGGLARSLEYVVGDGANVIAVGRYDNILHSSDTGANWSVVNSNTTGQPWLRKAAMNGDYALAVGDGYLRYSLDGGANWTDHTRVIPVAGGGHKAAAVYSDGTALAGSNGGSVIHFGP